MEAAYPGLFGWAHVRGTEVPFGLSVGGVGEMLEVGRAERGRWGGQLLNLFVEYINGSGAEVPKRCSVGATGSHGMGSPFPRRRLL